MALTRRGFAASVLGFIASIYVPAVSWELEDELRIEDVSTCIWTNDTPCWTGKASISDWRNPGNWLMVPHHETEIKHA